MKKRLVLITVLITCVMFGQSAWAQWSSDPAVNLAFADKPDNDQVQPKVKPSAEQPVVRKLV